MTLIVLKNQDINGELLQATYDPGKGMNLISYKKGDIEVIDQSTRPLFEERYAGLGALIGPHFHRRHPGTIPSVKDESLFPHIARVKAKGTQDPFSHGIGRYAPWKAEHTETKVTATLSGKDEWNGVPLSALEGENFKMWYTAELLPQGLKIEISVVSDYASIVGLHYYYALPTGKGKVTSDVQKTYYDGVELKTIPADWPYDAKHKLTWDLDRPADYTFQPFFNPLAAKILLDAEVYRLEVSYTCLCQENSWQLYHPQEASFVCIEPLSAQCPRRPNLTASALNVHIEILDNDKL